MTLSAIAAWTRRLPVRQILASAFLLLTACSDATAPSLPGRTQAMAHFEQWLQEARDSNETFYRGPAIEEALAMLDLGAPITRITINRNSGPTAYYAMARRVDRVYPDYEGGGGGHHTRLIAWRDTPVREIMRFSFADSAVVPADAPRPTGYVFTGNSGAYLEFASLMIGWEHGRDSIEPVPSTVVIDETPDGACVPKGEALLVLPPERGMADCRITNLTIAVSVTVDPYPFATDEAVPEVIQIPVTRMKAAWFRYFCEGYPCYMYGAAPNPMGLAPLR